jgi:hypothetical protein
MVSLTKKYVLATLYSPLGSTSHPTTAWNKRFIASPQITYQTFHGTPPFERLSCPSGPNKQSDLASRQDFFRRLRLRNYSHHARYRISLNGPSCSLHVSPFFYLTLFEAGHSFLITSYIFSIPFRRAVLVRGVRVRYKCTWPIALLPFRDRPAHRRTMSSRP